MTNQETALTTTIAEETLPVAELARTLSSELHLNNGQIARTISAGGVTTQLQIVSSLGAFASYRLMPATYAFLMVIVGLTVLLLAADILNPVQLTS